MRNTAGSSADVAPQAGRGVRRRHAGWIVLGAYLLARAWQLVMMGPVIESADSPMYRTPGAGWFDFGSTSWDGSSLRPWPSTLLYALLPTDRARVLAQFALSTLAWACLLHQIGRLRVRPLLATAAASVVAVLALTPSVSSFDVIIGAEPGSFALIAAFSAAVLQAIRTGPRVGSVAVMLLTAWAESLVRPVLGVMLLVPLLLVAQAWRAGRRDRPARDRAGGLLSAAAPLVVLVLVAVAGLNVLAYNATADKEWGFWRGTPGLEGRTIQQWGVLAEYSPIFPDLLADFVADDGAPTCLLTDAKQVAQPVVAGQPDPCPDGRAWVSSEFLGALTGEFAQDPLAARRYLRDALADASTLRVDGLPSLPTLVPDPVTGLYFATGKNVDVFALWTLLGLVALAGARWRGYRRMLPAAVWLTLAAAYIGLLGTAFLSPSEVGRVGLPATLLARVFLVVAIALLLDRVLSRRGRTRDAHSPDARPTDTRSGGTRSDDTRSDDTRSIEDAATGAGPGASGQSQVDRQHAADRHRDHQDQQGDPAAPRPA